MKKRSTLALILTLLILVTAMMTACKNNSTYNPPETEAPFYGYTELTLAKDPVIDADGRIILYCDEKIYYTSETEAIIGLMSQYSAQSINATLDTNVFEDMKVENGLVGVILKPETALPTGAYTFSVTIGNRYIVEFNYIVE